MLESFFIGFLVILFMWILTVAMSMAVAVLTEIWLKVDLWTNRQLPKICFMIIGFIAACIVLGDFIKKLNI